MRRTYNIPDGLYSRMEKYAEENYIDMTTFVKLALNEFLNRHESTSGKID